MRTTVHSIPKRFCATWPTTMFVLSPFVATTTASASSMPASRSTLTSIPCPTTNPPGQWSPRRASASSFSSMATTSQPLFVSFFATADPTRPQPTMIAFIRSDYTGAYRLSAVPKADVGRGFGGTRTVHQLSGLITSRKRDVFLLQHTLRIRDHHHLGRRLAQHVVHRRAEEPGLPPPARRRAHHDQVDVVLAGLVDDRLADRTRTDEPHVDVDPVLGGEQLRLGKRGLRLLLGIDQLGVQRPVERHAKDMERAHGAAALLGEPERRSKHLLSDEADLHRHEDALVQTLELRHEIADGRGHMPEHRLVGEKA